jgi:type III polyketide synthase
MASISALYIIGLGSQYPHYILAPEKLDEFAERFSDVSSPGYLFLLRLLNKRNLTQCT